MTTVELRIERLDRSMYDGVTLDPAGPRHRVDLAVVPCFEDERPLRGFAALLDWRTAGALSRLLRTGFCSGAIQELVLLPARADLPCNRVVLVGLGARAALRVDAARRLATDAVAMARRLRPTDALFALPSDGDRELVEALFAGVVVGLGGAAPSGAPDGDPADEAPDAAPWLVRGATAEPDDAETTSPTIPAVRWWIVADARHAGRLRRLLDGPPRAAVG